eukprot:11462124-Alexandrium_andersonii.AAC.1
MLDTSASSRSDASEGQALQGPVNQPLAPPAATATASPANLQPAGQVQLFPGAPAPTGARSQLQPG